MQVSIDTNPLRKIRHELTVVAADTLLKPTMVGVASEEMIYDLRRGNSISNGFYVDLDRFVRKLLVKIEFCAGDLLTKYSFHLVDALRETKRSRGENGLDLHTLGLALTR